MSELSTVPQPMLVDLSLPALEEPLSYFACFDLNSDFYLQNYDV